MKSQEKTLKFKKESKFRRLSTGTKVLYIVVTVLLILYSATLILPFLWLFVNSLQDPGVYLLNMTLGGAKAFALPDKLIIENYAKAFEELIFTTSTGQEVNLIGMLFNSIWNIAFRTGVSVLFCAFTAYAFAKYNFKLREPMYAVILFTMTVPIVGGSGSMFKLVWQLGIYNTPWYALLTSMGGIGFNFLVLYGFFKNVSWSYAEAVFIDGGGHYTVLFKIMLPQALPVISTLLIMSGIGVWNDYMTSLLYMPDFPTIASGLYSVSRSSVNRQGNFPVYYAAIFMSVIPVLILFICCSNVIMSNLSVGGLKG